MKYATEEIEKMIEENCCLVCDNNGTEYCNCCTGLEDFHPHTIISYLLTENERLRAAIKKAIEYPYGSVQVRELQEGKDKIKSCQAAGGDCRMCDCSALCKPLRVIKETLVERKLKMKHFFKTVAKQKGKDNVV